MGMPEGGRIPFGALLTICTGIFLGLGTLFARHPEIEWDRRIFAAATLGFLIALILHDALSAYAPHRSQICEQAGEKA